MTTKTFNEIQRFNQWWIKILLLVILIITLVPVGTNWERIDFTAVEILLQLGIPFLILVSIYFIYLLKLETTIDAEGVHYRFFPLIPARKTIPWNEIAECRTLKYNPLLEYGGWGYRISLKGKAFNVRGNKGIQLVLKNGKKILLGTQKENEAQNVIDSYFIKQL